MDLLETATKEYLESQYSNVVFEPRGKGTAPDFGICDCVAVEATRLVKVAQVNGEAVNTTERHPRTINSLRNAIETVKVKGFERSFFVNLDIEEPIDIREARDKLRKLLARFHEGDQIKLPETQVCNGLRVDVFATHTKKETPFQLGSVSGRDFAGWLGEDLTAQCAEALERKSKTADKIGDTFGELWLAVGSHLTIGDMSKYLPMLRRDLPQQDVFQRLVLVNVKVPSRSVELDLN